MFNGLTDAELKEAEQDLAEQRRLREYAKWDAELVGRYFRIIRTPHEHRFMQAFDELGENDYVTLEGSLSAGGKPYVYADVVYLHIQKRDGGSLICSGFEVSHANRREPYLKIQPHFISLGDFRVYLNSWDNHTGPVKHFNEIEKEEFILALSKATASFMNDLNEAAKG